MSLSSELDAAGYESVARPDLRNGVWTRLGDHAVLGDEVTEAALGLLAERTRDAARAQGYSVGWAEGRREALELATTTATMVEQRHREEELRREREHQTAVAALVAAADALRSAAHDVATRIADQAVDLAFDLTETIVGHELACEADPGAAVVTRVLAVLPDDPTTTVRLHPSVVHSDAVAALAEHGVRLVVDPQLTLHDAVVETETNAIDLRIDTALDRLREALR
ncbi:FliH/SctL family protein [Nocardioides caricicola]|uniref:FliH/SctL family protein n=1 Tax=Nocardioides caricicola TaxID=634770 RepID=A0ABW0N296_9ACTN